MLRVAIPNKGSLNHRAVELLQEAGYRCKQYDHELQVCDYENNVDFYFLRPRDIAVYVGSGVLDLGITGRDLALDSLAGVVELLPLCFGKSSFYYAVPNESDLTPDQLSGLRIATSYPNLVLQDLERRGVQAKVIRLDGAVEISIQLGVADAIADVVQSGRTLLQTGLKTVSDPILKSEAILVGRTREITDLPEVQVMIDRLHGIVVASEYVIVEYDLPRNLLPEACQVTPGIESPTVSPLNKSDWVAVKAMASRRNINQIMDQLKSLGAKGIIVMEIRACRL
jgi:ATP phosphoribosyltransferase